MARNDNNKEIRCSFCGKHSDQVRRVIAGPNVYICNECVQLCMEILDDDYLLPDEGRLTKYGKLLRATSLDELPELFNILLGHMSIVGPRPLLVKYLPLYNEEQRHRHDVRPGLTGWAQVNGRNTLSWEDKFRLDVDYVNRISFMLDVKVIFMTVKKVFCREGISSETSATMEEFKGTPVK